jgi:hypothetical protein
MITRAGTTGIFTGLITTIFLCPLFFLWPKPFLQGQSTSPVLITVAVSAILMVTGGWLAARRSGSAEPWRCAVLGCLSGGLAGTIVFCLWGAAAAGLRGGVANQVIGQTMYTFLALFLGGCGLGALGGWVSRLSRQTHKDTFDKEAPQMAMNVSITAVPASIFAAALTAAIFSHLSEQPGFAATSGELPLLVSLLLVLVSQLTLTLVIPHETRQAEHRSSMDEVKMGAYVSIAAAPVLILLLFLIDGQCFMNPLVVTALFACTAMSLISLRTLVRLVLPRRAAFPAPQEGRQKAQSKWFGTIAVSRAPRLMVLCVGCGLAMVLPLYVCVVSVFINVTGALAGLAFPQLLLRQAMVCGGMAAAAIAALSIIYIFYFNLGKWFNKLSSR